MIRTTRSHSNDMKTRYRKKTHYHISLVRRFALNERIAKKCVFDMITIMEEHGVKCVHQKLIGGSLTLVDPLHHYYIRELVLFFETETDASIAATLFNFDELMMEFWFQ